MGRDRYDRQEDRDTWDRASDEVRSWFGDEDAERRRERDEDDEPSRLDQTFGRGHAYAASGGVDRYSPRPHERSPSGYPEGYPTRGGDEELPRRHKSSTPRAGLEAGRDYGRNTPYEEPLSERYGRGREGLMYGQHTGYGLSVDQYTGRWDSTVPSGEHRGRGPRGYTRRDERIREDLAERLTDDPWCDPSDVEIAVKDGVVTLSGTVTDRDQKYRIEETVENVSGVKDVENNIKVRRNAL